MDQLNPSSTTQIVEAPAEDALEWLRKSLGQGFDISAAVLAAARLKGGRFLAIVSGQPQRPSFDYGIGGMIRQGAARERLAPLLVELGNRSGRLVVVEDDLRRKGDPSIKRHGRPCSFVRDRVIHWTDIGTPEDHAMETIDRGASGYPLNAFVITKSSSDLGLVDGGDAPERLSQEVAASLLAIVVAAFDAESFLIWTTDDFVAAS